MKGVSDIAQNKQKAESAMKEAEKLLREQRRKKWIPLSALVVANIVFLSLDARALDAVNKITQSIPLAIATVAVSGFMALYWWDFLYPHARRHRNKSQEQIALVGVAMGGFVSVLLAFLDYVVVSFSPAWMWFFVVLLTGVQGAMLARYWQIDGLIEAEAKREESIASRLDLQDTADDFKAEIISMENVIEKLEQIKARFPGKGQAEKAARAMGYPVLAEMLADDDGDGVENYRDRDYKPRPGQNSSLKTGVSFAKDAEAVELAESSKNAPRGGTN